MQPAAGSSDSVKPPQSIPMVGFPIALQELKASLHPDHFTIENVPARLSKLKQDTWADMAKTKQSITAAMLKRLAAR
jgi:bifunctional non-homologous end joining protein LigD